MDIFKYHAAIAEINGCKYVKELEALVRKYNKLAYGSPLQEVSTRLHYKLYAYALNAYKAKSKVKLPDFIYQDKVSIQRNFSKLIEYLTYEEIIDMFEFDTVVELATHHPHLIPKWHDVMLDKPIHFSIIWNIYLDWFDQHATQGVGDSVKKYLIAIRYKQTLSPDKPSTILDKCVHDSRESLGITLTQEELDKLQSSTILLEQQTKAAQTAVQELSNGKHK